MIYEKRTYTINPLKMADWLALYQSDALAVQTDHLGQLIGFFFTEIGVVNQVVHIWAYESLDDRLVYAAFPERAGRIFRYVPGACKAHTRAPKRVSQLLSVFRAS